jgi:hypothetical protein
MVRNSFVQINRLGIDQFHLSPCRQPDPAQEIIKLLAHVQVDLNRRFAPTAVKQSLGRSCAGHRSGLSVVRPRSRAVRPLRLGCAARAKVVTVGPSGRPACSKTLPGSKRPSSSRSAILSVWRRTMLRLGSGAVVGEGWSDRGVHAPIVLTTPAFVRRSEIVA